MVIDYAVITKAGLPTAAGLPPDGTIKQYGDVSEV